jgi:hypothetical protein
MPARAIVRQDRALAMRVIDRTKRRPRRILKSRPFGKQNVKAAPKAIENDFEFS